MRRLSLPRALDIRLCGKCNLRCPFCFGPSHELEPLNINELINLVKKFYNHGVETIVVTGGEPTLFPDLPRLLREAKRIGLNTVLSTNGLKLAENIEEIATNLDWIGLPLDGKNSSANTRMRGNPNHYDTILNLISTLKRKYPHVKIKLGTVVCALNKNDIVGMCELFDNSFKPDIWKIYQITYLNYALQNIELLKLNDEEFEQIVKNAELESLQHNIQLVVSRRNEQNGKYLFMEPDGSARVIVNGQEKFIGNFITDFYQVIASWRKFIDIPRLEQNCACTYSIVEPKLVSII